MDPSKIPPLPPDALQEIKDYLGIHEGSKPSMIVSRTQGWTLAVLLSILAAGVVIAAYVMLTREHQYSTTLRQLQDINEQLEELRKTHQDIEKKLVEHEADIEHLKEK